MKASMKLFLIASILLFTFNSICYAKKSLNDMTMWERLVGKKKVFAIATAPGIPKGKTPYFTSKSLEKKLPSFQRESNNALQSHLHYSMIQTY